MLYKYIIEIKNRVFLLVVSWITTTLVCYVYKDKILFLMLPKSINKFNFNSYLIATDVTDIFYSYLKLSYFFSTQFTFILVIYHVFKFISPGLYRSEYVQFTVAIRFIFLLFFFNLIVFYKILFPFSWDFFISFFTSEGFINIYFEAKINEFISLFINIYFLSSLFCIVFALMILLLEFSNNKLVVIANNRKRIYLLFILVSTIITPPDVINQIVLSLLLIIMLEFFIVIIMLKSIYDILKS